MIVEKLILLVCTATALILLAVPMPRHKPRHPVEKPPVESVEPATPAPVPSPPKPAAKAAKKAEEPSAPLKPISVDELLAKADRVEKKLDGAAKKDE
jgi:hypothetical protein